MSDDKQGKETQDCHHPKVSALSLIWGTFRRPAFPAVSFLFFFLLCWLLMFYLTPS